MKEVSTRQAYLPPRLVDYGSLLSVTGVTGTRGFDDVQTYVSSAFVARGNQSINICPVQRSSCIV